MKKFIYILFSAFVLLIVTPLCFAQTSAEIFQKLNFSIETAKKDFLVLEPFSVSLKIKNETAISTQNPVYLNFSSQKLIFNAENSNKTLFKIDKNSGGFTEVCDGCSTPKLLMRGQFLETKQIIEGFFQESFFSGGEYQLWAELIDADYKNPNPAKIISNKITVKISVPTGKNLEAQLMYKQIKELELNLAKDNLDSYIKLMDEFVEKYSDTPFSDKIAAELGAFYANSKNYEKAVEVYSKIKSDFLLKPVIEKRINTYKQKLRDDDQK